MTSQRDQLLDRVADHVLHHGLIGLSLRPVAQAVGTSDRMLVYHFKSRDALVAAVVGRTNQRAMAHIESLPGSSGLRTGVNRLWEAYQREPLSSCLDVYLQAAATGLIGREPYVTEVRRVGEQWVEVIRAYLSRCGAPASSVARVTTLVDSALYGFHLDLITDDPEELTRGVDDLARAAEMLAAKACDG